jgi:hypothetical protein
MITTTAAPTHARSTSTAPAVPTGAAARAVALLDERLVEWGQSGRSLVPATDVVGD